MITGIGTLRKHGGSLIVAIPPEIREIMNLKDGDDVKMSVEKITEEQKEEQRMRHSYTEVGMGEIFYPDEKRQDVKIARIDRLYYSHSSIQGGFLQDGKSIDDLPVTPIIMGVLFKGVFLSSGFIMLQQQHRSNSPEWVMRMLDGLGKFVITTQSGKRIVVRNPHIEFDAKTNPLAKPTVYNVKFSGQVVEQ